MKLVELGGPPFLVPAVRRDKVYDLAALLRHLRRDPALLAGAGAGPWPYIGVNCEVSSLSNYIIPTYCLIYLSISVNTPSGEIVKP